MNTYDKSLFKQKSARWIQSPGVSVSPASDVWWFFKHQLSIFVFHLFLETKFQIQLLAFSYSYSTPPV